MRKLILAVFLTLLAVGGCVSGLQTNAQRLYQIDSNYQAALTIAVAYKALPDCPSTVVCKKAAVVKQLQDADNVAFPALQSAQACVRATTCQNSDLAITAANTAIAAFTAITANLQVK